MVPLCMEGTLTAPSGCGGLAVLSRQLQETSQAVIAAELRACNHTWQGMYTWKGIRPVTLGQSSKTTTVTHGKCMAISGFSYESDWRPGGLTALSHQHSIAARPLSLQNTFPVKKQNNVKV